MFVHSSFALLRYLYLECVLGFNLSPYFFVLSHTNLEVLYQQVYSKCTHSGGPH